MIILRLVRIVAFAFALAFLFALSRHMTLERGGEDVPGMAWALGVVAFIFVGSAIFIERSRGPEANLQKDLLWGLAAGAVITIISRL